MKPKSAKEILTQAVAYNERQIASFEAEITRLEGELRELVNDKQRLLAEITGYRNAIKLLAP